jgi:hypothetical protein
MSNRKAKSPYQRYGKTPWKYSELLNSLLRARMSGSIDEANMLARQHSQKFGLKAEWLNPALDVVVDPFDDWPEDE